MLCFTDKISQFIATIAQAPSNIFTYITLLNTSQACFCDETELIDDHKRQLCAPIHFNEIIKIEGPLCSLYLPI